MTETGAARVDVVRLSSAGGRTHGTAVVVREEPLRILLAGPAGGPIEVATTLRTPGDEIDLAIGWLVSEGIAEPGDVDRVTFGDPIAVARPENEVTVHVRRNVDRSRVVARHTAVTASCGLCGRATIDDLLDRFGTEGPATGAPFEWATIADLPSRLRAGQRLFQLTGGTHAAGAFDRTGAVLALREDVGRHNALDALIGALAREGRLPLTDHVVALSGRVGLDLVTKARAAGAVVVVAVGAPTSLAVTAAERLGITVVGFARDGAGTVYSHPERLMSAGATHAEVLEVMSS